MKRFTRPLMFLAASIGFTPLVSATEGGGTVVPVGVQTIASGVLQAPGDYLLNYNLWMTANKFADANGNNALPGGRLRVEAHSLRYLHVFEGATLFGATPAFEVATAYVDSRLNSTYVNGRDHALGDTSFGPSLGWHDANLHQMASALLVAPTGSYDNTRTVNIGRNYYALQLDYAVSYFFGPGIEASAMTKVIFNRRNPATDYKSGTESDVDYALNWHPTREAFVGLGGYWHRQWTDDKVAGVVYDGGHRVRDLAIGPQAGWATDRYGVYVAWQKQIDSANTTKGNLLWVNAFFKF